MNLADRYALLNAFERFIFWANVFLAVTFLVDPDWLCLLNIGAAAVVFFGCSQATSGTQKGRKILADRGLYSVKYEL